MTECHTKYCIHICSSCHEQVEDAAMTTLSGVHQRRHARRILRLLVEPPNVNDDSAARGSAPNRKVGALHH